MDLHHRRAHAHAGDLGLECALVFAGEMRHVGRRASHVEADDLGRSRAIAAVRTMPTTPPAGPDRMLSLPWKRARVGEPAVRLHEQQARPRRLRSEFAGDSIDVAAQDGRQIGIDDRRVAARHEFHQRADRVRRRDLGEADFPRERGNLALMLGISIGVHEHDGRRPDAVAVGRARARREAARVRAQREPRPARSCALEPR